MSAGPPVGAWDREKGSLLIGAEMRTESDDSYDRLTSNGWVNALKPASCSLSDFEFWDVAHECMGGRGLSGCNRISSH